MDVQFIASVAVITADPVQSRRLYMDALGLPLQAAEGDDYFHSESIGGSKHFGVWPLTQAAQACFGTNTWPADRPIPQASVEFEVDDARAVQAAAEELRDGGYTLLHDARTEPWGQTVARLQTIEGLIVGISYASPTHHRFTNDECHRSPCQTASSHWDETLPQRYSTSTNNAVQQFQRRGAHPRRRALPRFPRNKPPVSIRR